MLARRKFLSLIGFGAGAAVAAKVAPPVKTYDPQRLIGTLHNINVYEAEEVTGFSISYGKMPTPPIKWLTDVHELNLRRYEMVRRG